MVDKKSEITKNIKNINNRGMFSKFDLGFEK